MKGRIKTYKEDKGYGFIIGEDQNDYFFHISGIKSMVQVQVGQIVEFKPSTNDKGNVAQNIIIDTNAKSNNKMYEIQGKRYRVSNIKEYGISEDIIGCSEIIKKETVNPNTVKGIFGLLEYMNTGGIIEKPTGIYEAKQDSWGRYTTSGSTCKKVRYLYITTYQGDNTKFYERVSNITNFRNGINIEKELAKLDELFNS